MGTPNLRCCCDEFAEMRRGGLKNFRYVPALGLKGTLMMGIVGESMGKKTFLEQDIRGSC